VRPAACEILIDEGCAPLRTRLAAAFEHAAGDPVQITRRWVTLAKTIADAPSEIRAARVVVVGLRETDGAPTEDLVQRLRVCQPALGIYLCTSDLGLLAPALLQYTRADIDDAFPLEHPANVRELRAVMMGRLLAPAPETALWRFWAAYNTCKAYRAAAHCLRSGYLARSVEEESRRLGQHRGTLCSTFRADGLPGPEALFRLGCDLHAVTLERAGVSAPEVAHRVGRPSAEALRVMRARLRRRAHEDAELRALWMLLSRGAPPTGRQ
jgi:hypothetical protein